MLDVWREICTQKNALFLASVKRRLKKVGDDSDSVLGSGPGLGTGGPSYLGTGGPGGIPKSKLDPQPDFTSAPGTSATPNGG